MKTGSFIDAGLFFCAVLQEKPKLFRNVIPGEAERRPGIHEALQPSWFPAPAFAGAGFAGMTNNRIGFLTKTGGPKTACCFAKDT
ncbi:hypothetical protein [Thalassospira sp. UBA1131]|uniref:hypothetical protein n=1 Tax=Thalassospira sp. UBA1131 TaxID=1947672 RepID=UPI0025D6E470|nr:hypothetical protein [Thalassospira sp. UBA1131]